VVPNEVLVAALVDPLPFLKGGFWSRVDVERFVPPERRNPKDRHIEPGRPDRRAPDAKIGQVGRPLSPDDSLPPAEPGGMAGNAMRAMGVRPRNHLDPRNEPPLLMLRSFDFSVEEGHSYRYRARLVVFGRSGKTDSFGSWSVPTERVMVP
jgi:hypothetical protein